jgi:magnesium-transporting ATPase (P-type)
MNKIPVNEEKISSFNKKSILLIIALVIGGIITGLILSAVFVNEANDRILHFNDEFGPGGFPGGQITVEPLTTSEILLPSLGVIIVCISVFLLIGLIAVYIKVFSKTKSKYVAGLLFFLVPLFVQSIFSVNTLRSLFVSSAIPFGHGIRESIGFGFGGLGQILVIVSVFEIIGLSILLYLSNE